MLLKAYNLHFSQSKNQTQAAMNCQLKSEELFSIFILGVSLKDTYAPLKRSCLKGLGECLSSHLYSAEQVCFLFFIFQKNIFLHILKTIGATVFTTHLQYFISR